MSDPVITSVAASPDMSSNILVISYPDAISREQADSVEERIKAKIGGLSVIVVGNGAHVTLLQKAPY